MTHDERPVTAAQLEQLLQLALQPVQTKMDRQFEWLREGVDQTLILLGNIEKRLETKIDNHEHRIKQLEKKAGLAQIAA